MQYHAVRPWPGGGFIRSLLGGLLMAQARQDQASSSFWRMCLTGWSRRGTVNIPERMHDTHDIFVGQPVKNVFAFFLRRHQRLLTQHSQLLRQRGLPDTRRILQLADVQTLAGRNLAQQHQPVLVGQRLEQGACLPGMFTQLLGRHGESRIGRVNIGHLTIK